MTWPVDRYGIIHRDVALASGISERTISGALRRHEIHGVGRGRYIPTRPLAGRDDAADLVYIATCIAAATGVGKPVLSHDSAAAVHGLPTLFPDRTHVHVTNGRDGGGTRRGAASCTRDCSARTTWWRSTGSSSPASNAPASTSRPPVTICPRR
ncbi:hypothetical protein BKA16_003057 [Gordonia humi]|uniref:Uncharacterized protein n=1 Tax=Gordonia humi TaxID=686429 RepID=A0A840EUA2_9ACTN|nr:hypothetical protein [Gordonia humi]